MHKTVFTIGDYPKAYMGYTSGRRWNGWATPYFELEEAIRVMEGNNEMGQYPMKYDKVYDQFYVLDTEEGELEVWKGENIATTEGIKHLYGIGAYCWIWDDANEDSCLYLAQEIEDFIYEFDTYHYKDETLDRMQTVEAIEVQLKELTTLQQAYEIWHNDNLTKEVKFEKLGGILKL